MNNDRSGARDGGGGVLDIVSLPLTYFDLYRQCPE